MPLNVPHGSFKKKKREANFLHPTRNCFTKPTLWGPSPALTHTCFCFSWVAASRPRQERRREREKRKKKLTSQWTVCALAHVDPERRSDDQMPHVGVQPHKQNTRSCSGSRLPRLQHTEPEYRWCDESVGGVAPPRGWRRIAGWFSWFRIHITGACGHPMLQAATHAATFPACSAASKLQDRSVTEITAQLRDACCVCAAVCHLSTPTNGMTDYRREFHWWGCGTSVVRRITVLDDLNNFKGKRYSNKIDSLSENHFFTIWPALNEVLAGMIVHSSLLGYRSKYFPFSNYLNI